MICIRTNLIPEMFAVQSLIDFIFSSTKPVGEALAWAKEEHLRLADRRRWQILITTRMEQILLHAQKTYLKEHRVRTLLVAGTDE